ncbi:MAG: hypothetical protein A2297_00320 [Elusimicrobia bacterium RIFOXYB2_FULL_48_7]|nr:MAG: hypothetical protein A2297_00320 [Elusimicrobia bacterium RIFOXYB2_FULL_48_7]
MKIIMKLKSKIFFLMICVTIIFILSTNTRNVYCDQRNKEDTIEKKLKKERKKHEYPKIGGELDMVVPYYEIKELDKMKDYAERHGIDIVNNSVKIKIHPTKEKTISSIKEKESNQIYKNRKIKH